MKKSTFKCLRVFQIHMSGIGALCLTAVPPVPILNDIVDIIDSTFQNYYCFYFYKNGNNF